MLPYMLLGNLALGLNYINTAANPANHRFISIPPPEPAPRWLRRYKIRGSMQCYRF